ncbi:MAG: hypothetical protein ACRDHC_02055, partial [Actinomycetota bacterium]
AGGPAAGEVLSTNDQIGEWVRSGTGGGDDFSFLRFNRDGTFAAGHYRQVLSWSNPPAGGTYELADGTITFMTDERSSFCTPSETWVWEATLPAEGRLRTVSVDGTDCGIALGTETWVRLSSED